MTALWRLAASTIFWARTRFNSSENWIRPHPRERVVRCHRLAWQRGPASPRCMATPQVHSADDRYRAAHCSADTPAIHQQQHGRLNPHLIDKGWVFEEFRTGFSACVYSRPALGVSAGDYRPNRSSIRHRCPFQRFGRLVANSRTTPFSSYLVEPTVGASRAGRSLSAWLIPFPASLFVRCAS